METKNNCGAVAILLNLVDVFIKRKIFTSYSEIVKKALI